MKEDTTPTRWTDAFLDKMRLVEDPLADDVIRGIMEKGELETINAIFKTLRSNAALKREDLPTGLQDFFAKASQLPEWADMDLLDKGAQYFANHAVEFSMLLYFVSLPMAYTSARGAKVLASTGQLEEGKPSEKDPKKPQLKKFTRRIMETSQFIFNIGAAGGFSETGLAIESAMKIRLMHAIIRYYIQKPRHPGSPPWDIEADGAPINQEDLTGTMLSFSSLVYDGMDQLQLNPEPEMRAAHFHLWKVVGHLMGVSPELMPNDMAEGNALGWQILRRNRQESVDGKALTKALLDFSREAIPGSLFDHLPAVFLRYYCGDTAADILGVPNYGWFWEKFVPAFIGFFIRELDDATHVTSFISRLSARLQNRFLQHIINSYYGYKEIEFQLPDSFREKHNLQLGAGHQ